MFTLEQIYGVDFKEFCRRTFTTPDLYIKATEAEIKMLQDSYEANRQKLRQADLTHDERDELEALLIEISTRLAAKKRKLRKYKGVLNEM